MSLISVCHRVGVSCFDIYPLFSYVLLVRVNVKCREQGLTSGGFVLVMVLFVAF